MKLNQPILSLQVYHSPALLSVPAQQMAHPSRLWPQHDHHPIALNPEDEALQHVSPDAFQNLAFICLTYTSI